MFSSLPSKFREYDLHSDVRTLLILQKAMEKGLVKTLGDIFTVLKGIVVKDPKMKGPYTKAFYNYFLNITMLPGERLSDSILRSETFKNWRDDNLNRFEINEDVDKMIDTFLNEVHMTSYDIQQILDGQEIWDNDNPFLDDTDPIKDSKPKHHNLNKMADYSNLSLEELHDRMKKVLERQKGKHSGGSHWIGTGGISPYGSGGAAKDGLRVGGSGGGKMARQVLNDKKYFPLDKNATLNDNNIDAALSSLNGVFEESAFEELDIPLTINSGIKRGGFFLPELTNKLEVKLQVLLFIDNGGYSMDPFIKTVQSLFKKMKTRFAHDLETYYFHNTIYDHIYTDIYRSKYISIDKILSKNKDYRIFIIGDASMAPYELNAVSRSTYKSLKKKFSKIAWLNPEPEKYWKHTYSIQVIKEFIPMFPLSIKGIEDAVLSMNKKKK